MADMVTVFKELLCYGDVMGGEEMDKKILFCMIAPRFHGGKIADRFLHLLSQHASFHQFYFKSLEQEEVSVSILRFLLRGTSLPISNFPNFGVELKYTVSRDITCPRGMDW